MGLDFIIWPDPGDEDKRKKIRFYIDLHTNYVGKFLVLVTWLESDIEEVLALLIYGEKEKNKNIRLFRYGKLPKLSFYLKIFTLMNIIKKCKLVEDEEFKYLDKHLNGIRQFRNKLAHSPSYNNESFIEKDPKDRIRVSKYKDGKKVVEEITIKEIEEKLDAASKAQIILKKVLRRIELEWGSDRE